MKTKTTPPALTPFALALRKRILAKITAYRRDGTTGVGVETMLGATLPKGPDYNLPGVILGTNAQYYYKQLFLEVLATIPAAKTFILH